MSGNDEHSLVPRLRFPQFRDVGKWKKVTPTLLLLDAIFALYLVLRNSIG